MPKEIRLRSWFCLAFPLALGACAYLPANEEWEPKPGHQALPATFAQVDGQGIRSHCGDPRGVYLHGCAVRDFDKHVCVVYTRADPQKWLIDHERRHCDGWDHPGTQKTALGSPL